MDIGGHDFNSLEPSARIIAFIAANPTASAREIADGTGLSRATVTRRLPALVRRGVLANSQGARQRPEWTVGISSSLKMRPVGKAPSTARVKDLVPSGVNYPKASSSRKLSLGDLMDAADAAAAIASRDEMIGKLRQEIATLETDLAALRRRSSRDPSALVPDTPLGSVRKTRKRRRAVCECGSESSDWRKYEVLCPGCGGRHPNFRSLGEVVSLYNGQDRKIAGLESDLAGARKHIGRITGEMDGMRTELEQLREILEAHGLVMPRGDRPAGWTFGDFVRLGRDG